MLLFNNIFQTTVEYFKKTTADYMYPYKVNLRILIGHRSEPFTQFINFFEGFFP